jgi:hypothetical protein
LLISRWPRLDCRPGDSLPWQLLISFNLLKPSGNFTYHQV